MGAPADVCSSILLEVGAGAPADVPSSILSGWEAPADVSST